MIKILIFILQLLLFIVLDILSYSLMFKPYNSRYKKGWYYVNNYGVVNFSHSAYGKHRTYTGKYKALFRIKK